jgi:NADPH:quinone reductase-like Zn-dependent oxidoreductase
MKAIVYHKKNASNKLVFSDVNKPIAKDDEVLVQIAAVSINAADYRSMKMGMIPKSKIFGSAISGIVASVGSKVRGFLPNDEVVGDLADFGFGGLAEYAVAPEKALVKKPGNISFADAACFPVAATTALNALSQKGKIQEQQKVLIVGASGGVGTFAIQLAKNFGARVTAVCSAKNIAQADALGADFTIDYSKEDFTKSEDRYDLIVAINGNYPFFAYKRILSSRGTHVMVGGDLSQIFRSIFFGWIFSFGGKKMRFLSAKSNRESLQSVLNLAANKKIKSVIEKRYSLDKTADAMQHISEGHASAKVLIVVREDLN